MEHTTQPETTRCNCHGFTASLKGRELDGEQEGNSVKANAKECIEDTRPESQCEGLDWTNGETHNRNTDAT